jgi:outer membrane protein assembly factor BamA
LKKNSTKITAFILIATIIAACNTVKRVPDGKHLLTKNKIIVNDKLNKEENITNQLYQKPNNKILGFNLRLNLFNLANPNLDSIYQSKFAADSGSQLARPRKSFWYKGIHNFLKKTGEPPVIIDTLKSKKSALRLEYYYFNEGYFTTKATYKTDTLSTKKAQIKYTVNTGKPYFIDSLKTTIQTKVLDSMFKSKIAFSQLKSGKQYKTALFNEEKNRVSDHFRNNGVYDFQPNYVTFDIDTINHSNKANVNLIINNFSYQENDLAKTEPFKVYKISDVNIYTDYSPNSSNQITDSTSYKNYNLYSQIKLKYKPKAITDAVFISKGSLFADNKTVLTTRYLNNLKIFNYPAIQYVKDPRDTTAQSLIAKIYLTPRKKYSFGISSDFTHSNIQDIGIGGAASLTIRNIFNGAETLEISGRGNVGASKDLANPKDNFFNVSEYGVNLKLNFPRIFIPFPTERIIPKSMIPSTLIAVGLSVQRNIGLDKENFTSSLSYNWSPKKNTNASINLINIQFVRNLNPQNYFNVYTSSYDALNQIGKVYNTNVEFIDGNGNLIIEKGTSGFTSAVLSNQTSLTPDNLDYKTVKSNNERKARLTENDFIFSTNYTFSQTTKASVQDNTFYQFKAKIESAGSLLTLFSNASNLRRNGNNNYKIFNVEYSEYLKTEFDYIKYWDLSQENVLAFRTFLGIAIPFGNSTNIPFSRSYFSGGSNDNRAWQPYNLGPGSSGAVNDFNEANMKIAFSSEFRFKILGSLKGALFADAGNIWNVLDNVLDEKSTFKNLSDLKEIALGTGMGFRYDLSFFVMRFDLGFKTYNPAKEIGNRWFKELNFSQSVLNFGINYPF